MNTKTMFPGDTKPRLTSAEINDRLDRFNATVPNDWSVFDDVPESQHVCVMYPHRIDVFSALSGNRAQRRAKKDAQ